MDSKLLSSSGTDQERLRGLENCISGYHRTCLEKPYHLDHVSQNMCDLLGYTAEEVKQRFITDFGFFVCESDREKFRSFLDSLAEKEQTLTLNYRMLKKDGTLLPVCDITTSRHMGDGKMYGLSVLSACQETKPLGDLISSVLPYGFLQCTCEKYPKVTYINRTLIEYLYINDHFDSWEQNVRENVFFMIPFDQRELFRSYLDEAQQKDRPIQIEHDMFRGDGTRARLTGWMSKVPGNSGKNEFAVLYRQIEDTEDKVEPIQETSYFPVLKRSYNALFELDLNTSMVECIHGLDDTPMGSLSGIQMTVDSANHLLLNNYVYSEDLNMMTAFLNQIDDPDDDWDGKSVLQVEFRLKEPNGLMRFLCVAVHLDDSRILICCRNVTQLTYSSAQALESQTLQTIYEWLDFLSTHNEENIGMLLLEDTPEGCTLLYGSSSVLHYLGLDAEDGSHRSTRPTLDECLEAADITRDDFYEMVGGKDLYLWSRSAPDKFQFQLTCHAYTNKDKKLYILWCKNIVMPKTESSSKRVFARTFGHFDLFLDNTPITFSSSKEKELMALLIDRNGGTLSPNEAISYLWEDEPSNDSTSARYRKLAMGLKRTLEKYGIEDILINYHGVRSIDTSAIRCDYYELLAGNAKYRRAFHNAYMTDYSWGEETLATLWNYSD